MRTVRELTQLLSAKYKDVAPLAQRAVENGLDGDDLTTFRSLNDEIASLEAEKRDAELLEQDARAVSDRAAQLQQSAGRVAGTQPRDQQGQPVRTAQGDDTPRYRSIGEAFANSEQLGDFRNRVGMGSNSRAFRVGSLDEGYREEFATRDQVAPEVRALLGDVDFTGNLLQPQRLPGIVAPDLRPLPVRGLFTNGTTDSTTVEFVKEGTRTNNAAEVAEATDLVTGQKPESGFTLTTDSAPVRTIAHIIYATRQALDDVGQLRMMIDQFLIRGIEERIDRQLLLGNGTAPNLRGLLSTSGVQVLDDTPTTGYWATNPLPADANKWDRLRRAMTEIRITGRARTTGMVLSPTDLEEAAMQKDANGQYLFPAGGPFGAGALTTLWGVPVTEQEDLTAGQAVVGDFQRGAAVLERMDAQIFVSDSNRDLFERNIITILGEARIAFPVFRPEAFANVTIG